MNHDLTAGLTCSISWPVPTNVSVPSGGAVQTWDKVQEEPALHPHVTGIFSPTGLEVSVRSSSCSVAVLFYSCVTCFLKYCGYSGDTRCSTLVRRCKSPRAASDQNTAWALADKHKHVSLRNRSNRRMLLIQLLWWRLIFYSGDLVLWSSVTVTSQRFWSFRAVGFSNMENWAASKQCVYQTCSTAVGPDAGAHTLLSTCGWCSSVGLPEHSFPDMWLESCDPPVSTHEWRVWSQTSCFIHLSTNGMFDCALSRLQPRNPLLKDWSRIQVSRKNVFLSQPLGGTKLLWM